MFKSVVLEKEFIKLISENQKIILKVCNVYCSAPEDRDDLFQDVLIQLWKAYPSFDNRSKLTTWIYRVAFNTAVSRYRKEIKIPVKETISEDIVVADDLSESENIQLLREAIKQLGKVEVAIIMLYMEGTRYKEIGEIMGLSESNVGFKINQIKKKLREQIK